MKLWLCFLVALALPQLARAQDAATLAQEALVQLNEASAQLEAAEGARNRVLALSETIRAYEAGLAAVRDGLRNARILETQLDRSLQARREEIAQLLGALQSIGAAPGPLTFLHPAGPLGSARAGMVFADLTPVLDAKAQTLRTDLEDIANLRFLQAEAEGRLVGGLKEVRDARLALNTAMAERTELPRRFVEDPVKRARLLETSETLDAFASGLSDVALGDNGWTPPPLAPRKGALKLPVRGVILRLPGEADAAGVVRPGVLLATRPQSLVSAPVSGTLRYVGALLDLGTVVILEPQADMLMIFSGLGTAYGAAGEVVPEGAPLGLMGGMAPDLLDAEFSTDGDGAGTARSETLYIEVRQNNTTQDPRTWFRFDEDE